MENTFREIWDLVKKATDIISPEAPLQEVYSIYIMRTFLFCLTTLISAAIFSAFL